jgi:hypothetical protein
VNFFTLIFLEANPGHQAIIRREGVVNMATKGALVVYAQNGDGAIDALASYGVCPVLQVCTSYIIEFYSLSTDNLYLRGK